MLVIYDAEDRPEPDQLRRPSPAFRQLPERIVCLQAKLNFYNQRQNLLTRWFTSEYSVWFDLFLPGLTASGWPIPLGGTSNHFQVRPLKELGGWDPFNVTEDCDLGIRLHKHGYRRGDDRLHHLGGGQRQLPVAGSASARAGSRATCRPTWCTCATR